MKKQRKKLELNKETILRLERATTGGDDDDVVTFVITCIPYTEWCVA